MRGCYRFLLKNNNLKSKHYLLQVSNKHIFEENNSTDKK